MTRNFFLTSLDTPNHDGALRYYGGANEYGFNYCNAMLGMEASAKYILARFPIDEILVIGVAEAPEGAEEGKSMRLKDWGASGTVDREPLSAFGLYCTRLAQYINELNPEQEAYNALLPEEKRPKLIEFINDFMEKNSERETKRLNRFFDELACNPPLWEKIREELFRAFPAEGEDARLTLKWVKNYLYTQLKPSAAMEPLQVNENVRVRYIPASMMEKTKLWISGASDTDQEDSGADDDINVYVSLSNDAAVASHIILNMLNIQVSTPGSHIRLNKIFSVSEAYESLTGAVFDSTAVSMTTDLVVAAHAFLNYSKTDMLVDFWEKCGGRDERINRLVYAARHVDTGISMCNIQEVEEGVQQLRQLFGDERSWTEDGKYGPLFGVIAGCIQADYKSLMEDEEGIPFINLIKWAYRHQLYQQVLTLVESHAPANLVKNGIFYYCDDEARKEDITKLFAEQRMQLQPYEYYKIDESIEHYFIKNYDRAAVRLNGSRGEDRNAVYADIRTKSLENRDPAKIGGYTACNSAETMQQVLYAYYHLGEVRNKISHADSKAMAERRLVVAENDISYAMTFMKESIECFINSYDKALEEVQGKDPKIVLISPDDVRSAANRMKYENHDNNGRRPFPRRRD